MRGVNCDTCKVASYGNCIECERYFDLEDDSCGKKSRKIKPQEVEFEDAANRQGAWR